MTVKLLTEHHLEVLSLKGGCTGSSESTLVKMPHSWKSHVAPKMFSCKQFTTVSNQTMSRKTAQLQRLWLSDDGGRRFSEYTMFVVQIRHRALGKFTILIPVSRDLSTVNECRGIK